MKRTVLVLLLTAILCSCKRSEQYENTLDGKIRRFSKEACTGGSVTRYDYDGQKIFVFDDGCQVADGGAVVTNSDGDQICFLGGFTGNLHCLGKRFDSTAKNPVVIFEQR